MAPTVAVVGGGISGLAACYYLARGPHPPKVLLLEAGARLGGWLQSTRAADGAVFEHGPRGIRPGGAAGADTLHMVSELGLADAVLPVPGDHPASRNRFLYVAGALHKLPSGLGALLRTVPPFSRALLWSGLRDLLAPAGTEPDESIHAFALRRFGREVADIAVDSVCRGVFAGDCRALSVRSCFPLLFRAERRRRSVLLGLGLALGSGERRGGGGGGGPAHARSRVGAEPPGAGRALEPVVAAGRDGDAARGAGGVPAGARSGAAVPSAPAQPPPPPRWPLGALAEALPAEAAVLAQELRRIPAVSVAVVNLQYEGAALPVTGFGHLVPSLEDGALLGIVYDSVAFPQHNGAAAASLRLTVMLGGAWFEQSFGDPAAAAPELLLHRAQAAVREQLGLEPAPTRSIVRVHQACIPQYTLGHWQRTEHIGRFLAEHRLPLSLIGASYSGVSVNDCIASAKVAVERLLGPQR
uniref:Protoporphyrinogen oxidase n=1 Tax=Amazona collaria TaxID=241587 RepID=A0A8B9F9V8_9PSIT